MTGASGPLTLSGQSLPAQPQSLAIESITSEDITLSDWRPLDTPLGGPGPEPTDAPFGADVQVTTSANAQSHPSMAATPDGSYIFVVYTDQVTPTNRDVRVARSQDGGQTWVAAGIATSGTYNEFEPIIVYHNTRFIVFFSQDDPALLRGYRYAVCAAVPCNTWTLNQVNFGVVLREFRNADAMSGQDASGTSWMYVVWRAWCDGVGQASPCAGAGNDRDVPVTHLFNAGGTLATGAVYFPFIDDPTTPDRLFAIEPTIAMGSGWTVWLADINADTDSIGCAPGERDILWMRAVTGTNLPSSWQDAAITGLFCNQQNFRADGTAYGVNHAFAMQLRDPGVTGFAESVIATLYNNNNAEFPYTIDLLAGGGGINYREPALFASPPLVHATYEQNGDLGYAYSVDAAVTWTAPGPKVNANPGTVADAVRSDTVTYGGKVRVCWQDTRGGGDIYCTSMSGYSFYFYDRNPRYGTLDLATIGTVNVPYVALYTQGAAETVTAPTPDIFAPGSRYIFTQWSDLTTNPVKSLTVGAADVQLVAQYATEYFLDISTSIGTTTPISGWYPAGASVTIEWIAPAPGVCVRSAFGGWTGSGLGSFTGMTNPVGITMNGPITEVADATREYCYNLDVFPGSGFLTLTIDGTSLLTPQSGWWADGSAHTVTADSPQPFGTDLRFVFAQWEDGPGTPTRSITVTGPTNLTAQYLPELRLLITATPSDCDFTVDGTLYPGGPQTLWFLAATNHTVDVPQPQLIGVDTRYQFGNWDDNGAKSHVVSLTVPLALELTCITEYRHIFNGDSPGLSISVDGGPQVTLPQNSLWWASGSVHNVSFPSPQSVGADSRRVFRQWSDSSTLNPRVFSVSGPTTLTIQTTLQHRIRFETFPGNVGITIRVDGSPIIAPGEAWLPQGSPATINATSPSLDPVDPTGTRYVWQSWSDSLGRVHTIAVNGPATYTATYGTEYYLDVVTLYASTIGEGWKPAGTTAFAGVGLNPVPGPTGTQYLFVRWTGDATGFVFSMSNGILMDGPKTATAEWMTQYWLTVDSTYGIASGQGWKDAGSTATASLAARVASGPPETRYMFERWTVGAADFGTGLTSNGILMDAPKTVRANWVTQYHITLPAPMSGVNPSCTGVSDCWYNEGSTTATVSASEGAVESDPGRTRLGFIRWTGDATGTQFSQSNPITVNGPKVVDWNWQTQHKLTLVGDRGAIGQPDSTDGWYTAGNTATLNAPADPVPGTVDGVRYRFTGWSGAYTGNTPSASVLMDGPKTVTVSWQTQFRVRITTTPITTQATIDNQPANPAGDWFDEDDSITIAVGAEVQSGGKTYKFVSWDGVTSATFTVTEPLDIVANFRESALFDSPVTLGGLIAAIVAAMVIALFLLWRRKKEPEEEGAPVAGAPLAPMGMMPPPPPAAPMEAAAGTMECPSCGLTIEARTGPCPICGAQVVAPAIPAKDERIGRLEEAYKSGRISKEQYQANLRKLRGNT